jgi:effector-binding domain-containing protein
MKIFGLIVAAIVIALFLLYLKIEDRNLRNRYIFLREPRIAQMQKEKVIEAEVKGDPNVAAGKGFSAIFNMAYKLKGVKISAPKARWLNAPEEPKEGWIGIFAMQVPDSINTLPQQNPSEVQIRLGEWEYGEVAEILHIGPYQSETPSIEKLKVFIKGSGFEISGPHEEEYIKGPSMLGKGDPSRYMTIIRYQVKKQLQAKRKK